MAPWHPSAARPLSVPLRTRGALAWDEVRMASSVVMSMANSIRGEDVTLSPQRAGLLLVPFAAVMIGLFVLVLVWLSIPPSSSPAEDSAVAAAGGLWVLGVVAMIVGVGLGTIDSSRIGWSVGASIVVAMTLVGWFVAGRFDVAWLDSCNFGTNSGDRCISRDGSAPRLIGAAWPIAGSLIGAVGIGMASMVRRSRLTSQSRNVPTATS